MELEAFLTCKEVASRYGVSTETVWRWIRSGKLPAVLIGGRNYRVRLEDLQEIETPDKNRNKACLP